MLHNTDCNLKQNKDFHLIFDPASFWYPNPFLNFDNPLANYDFETSNKEMFLRHHQPKFYIIIKQ